MARRHRVTIDGNSFLARRGELLLDAALSNGLDLPHDCRAGHCGTCCVRLVSGAVQGGEGAEPDSVHACQCRLVADVVIESGRQRDVRTVDGVVSALHPLSSEVVEVGIRTDRSLPHHPGQYAKVRFSGYPSRPFSLTHPLRGTPDGRSIWFHVRRMQHGRVTPWLGKRIGTGHRVELTGPFGAAHFRPCLEGRLILVATNTGFAPIWSIAVAALRENPARSMMVVAGGRTREALYMGPALARLARFPNVRVVPVCSAPQTLPMGVSRGRPTDYLPRLLPTDVLYACGAPPMVESIRSIAALAGAACYADPFLPTAGEAAERSLLARAKGWLVGPAGLRRRGGAGGRSPGRREPPLETYAMAQAREG